MTSNPGKGCEKISATPKKTAAKKQGARTKKQGGQLY